MFFPFQIRKTFYRKMVLFSVDQKNIFSWSLIFRETNIRKCWKYFFVNYFQWNKRTLKICNSLLRRLIFSCLALSIAALIPECSCHLIFIFIYTIWFQEIAEKYKKTVAQIVVRWGIQRNTVVISKTSKFERLQENYLVFDFELAKEDMELIKTIDRKYRTNQPAMFWGIDLYA